MIRPSEDSNVGSMHQDLSVLFKFVFVSNCFLLLSLQYYEYIQLIQLGIGFVGYVSPHWLSCSALVLTNLSATQE